MDETLSDFVAWMTRFRLFFLCFVPTQFIGRLPPHLPARAFIPTSSPSTPAIVFHLPSDVSSHLEGRSRSCVPFPVRVQRCSILFVFPTRDLAPLFPPTAQRKNNIVGENKTPSGARVWKRRSFPFIAPQLSFPGLCLIERLTAFNWNAKEAISPGARSECSPKWDLRSYVNLCARRDGLKQWKSVPLCSQSRKQRVMDNKKKISTNQQTYIRLVCYKLPLLCWPFFPPSL